MRTSRKSLAVSWLFFTLYVIALMTLSYVLHNEPYFLGLPRWVAIGNLLVPALFVILLVFVVEKLIPDFPLTDEGEEGEDRP